jgi:hypothetical protein
MTSSARAWAGCLLCLIEYQLLDMVEFIATRDVMGPLLRDTDERPQRTFGAEESQQVAEPLFIQVAVTDEDEIALGLRHNRSCSCSLCLLTKT